MDVEAVLADLKDFQRRTAVYAFKQMFSGENPAIRFLVADEVGLGKTHVAKGVIAQAIDHLQRTGDKRQDIIYVCSNAAIAHQNLRKLAPPDIAPLKEVDRLTMLPLVELNEGDDSCTGVNLLPITPSTSLKFGHRTGMFLERCLAYAFLRAHWGPNVMNTRARRVFWHGVSPETGEARLRDKEEQYRSRITGSLHAFGQRLAEVDEARNERGSPAIRDLFDRLVTGLKRKREFPRELQEDRRELIGEVRRVMASVGLDALRPDLVVLDEFQRFKELLQLPDARDFAVELAHQLFNYRDPETGRTTRTLLVSATPYRMYTISDEIGDDHYEDFLNTCSFLFQDPARVERLEDRFRALRTALTSADPGKVAENACRGVEDELRAVMARTERLAATPGRDGMLSETDTQVAVKPHDLSAYLRFGGLAEAVEHHEPVEYWKSGPYLVNFMEGYKFKEAVVQAVADGRLGVGMLDPGPGLLSWDDIEKYQQIDPQNGRLRWLLDDLANQRAFELLWVPPSMRYYDAGSVYESPEAAGFTKRLIFSGWTVVPKAVSSLVSFEAERRAFAARSHNYSAKYRRRGGQRLRFRTPKRSGHARPGEASGDRRAAAMTAFLLTWPSPSLARLGDPRPQAPRQRPRPGIGEKATPAAGDRPQVSDVLDRVASRLRKAIEPLIQTAPTDGAVDRRWYWAAPLFLDQQRTPEVINLLLGPDGAGHWEDDAGRGLRAHIAEARAMVDYMVDYGTRALGRPPGDLVEVLAELAVGGPAQCALRMISSVCGLPISDDEGTAKYAARIAAAFRSFFNAPEVTAVITSGHSEQPDGDEGEGRYWRDVVRHCVDGNLQAVLDEHGHILSDWLGHLSPGDTDRRRKAADDDQRWEAACGIAGKMAEALELRTSSFRVDVPVRKRKGRVTRFDRHTMRTRFAVAFANQTLERGGEARVESVSAAFNSPFWPFVLTSTSIGQEGLDFHLWCHAVVHWNLPYNPVDLEQREGRVHRYKGHAVRRNIASTHGDELLADGLSDTSDPWAALFAMAADRPSDDGSEMVPYWVYEGRTKIERHVPVLPFSREQAALPRLRKTLAAYRLAFGQPRQEELVEFLGAGFSEEQLTRLAKQLRIDLSPPELVQVTDL